MSSQFWVNKILNRIQIGHTLENVEVEAYERRRVFDIPPVNLIVTEHQSQIKTCPDCGRSNKAVFPESVKYPVQYDPNILASAIVTSTFNATLLY